MNTTFDQASFRRSLLSWYRKQGRNLPWRNTQDPYAILVSEFMLQQTQVNTVLPYYHRWLKLFPDFVTLAGAPEQDVLRAWQGLGYYARARNLRRTAQIIVEKYGGHFPRDLSANLDLPGLGQYTTNAVLTFAFDGAVPIVEANIARLLSRLFNLQTAIDSRRGQTILWRHASELLPKSHGRVYNSALMDLGAMVCRPHPLCCDCPVRKFCKATAPELLPIRRPRSPIRLRRENHSFHLRGGHLLLEQSQDRWRGMWILPRLRNVPAEGTLLHRSLFSFTNHRITLSVFAKRPGRERSIGVKRWFATADIDSIPMPSPHRRAVKILLPPSS